MLEVNLLPGGTRKKAAAAGPSIDFNALFAAIKGRMGDLWTVGAFAAIVVALGVGGFLYWKQGHDRVLAEARLTKAQEDSVRYSKVVAARNAAQAKRDTLLRQVNLVRAIDDDRYIWPHIMEEVSKALPEYVWITIMTFAGNPQGSANVVALPVPPKPKPGTVDTAKIKKPPVVETTPPRDQVVLRVTGRTVDIQAMTRFTAELEASPFFGNVLIERTTPNTETEPYTFQLIIPYTRPDSNILRRVPLMTTPVRGGR
jgi:Tfp pilus assembly protein PilN